MLSNRTTFDLILVPEVEEKYFTTCSEKFISIQVTRITMIRLFFTLRDKFASVCQILNDLLIFARGKNFYWRPWREGLSLSLSATDACHWKCCRDQRPSLHTLTPASLSICIVLAFAANRIIYIIRTLITRGPWIWTSASRVPLRATGRVLNRC